MSQSPNPYRASAPPARAPLGNSGATGLAEVLERVLDRGLVIAGDVQVNLLDIELLTLKVRLLLASADTAEQLGIDWWRSDPFLSSAASADTAGRDGDDEVVMLRERVAELEAVVSTLTEDGEPAPEVASRTGEEPARGA